MKGTGTFVVGLIVGTALGMTAGMLIAPTSGSQFRSSIIRRSRKYSKHAIDAVRQYVDGIRHGTIKGDPGLAQDDTEEFLNRLANEAKG